MNTWLKNLILTFIVIVAPSVVIDVLFYEMPDLGESIIIFPPEKTNPGRGTEMGE